MFSQHKIMVLMFWLYLSNSRAKGQVFLTPRDKAEEKKNYLINKVAVRQNWKMGSKRVFLTVCTSWLVIICPNYL